MISFDTASDSTPALTNFRACRTQGLFLLRHCSPTLTAVQVDAGFFLKRAEHIYGHQSPEATAKQLHRIALDHLNDERGRRIARLYRIFVYDAPPAEWRGHTPIGRKSVDYGCTEIAEWRRSFHQCLKSLRKVALRFGHIPTTHVNWQLAPIALKALIKGERDWASITDQDFRLELRQKGVDMRLGLDIASLTHKGQVNQIVLISGDSDFVPAAKLARRGGIDFLLDPMWATIRPDLYEHIDGLKNVCPKPTKPTPPSQPPDDPAADKGVRTQNNRPGQPEPETTAVVKLQ
jgi:uncharacterized LabA/DUF88 family protein